MKIIKCSIAYRGAYALSMLVAVTIGFGAGVAMLRDTVPELFWLTNLVESMGFVILLALGIRFVWIPLFVFLKLLKARSIEPTHMQFKAVQGNETGRLSP